MLGTFYAPGLGACGKTNDDNQLIAAVSHQVFDSFSLVSLLSLSPFFCGPEAIHSHRKGGDPNNNSICGRKVHAECELFYIFPLLLLVKTFVSIFVSQLKGRAWMSPSSIDAGAARARRI